MLRGGSHLQDPTAGLVKWGLLTHKLQRLVLFHNQYLTGTLPADLARLATVEDFDVASCWLSGLLPTELGLLTAGSNLAGLILNDNLFSGNIPSQWGGVPNETFWNLSLQVLLLENNQLGGTLCTEPGMLTFLMELHLANNTQLMGTIPWELSLLATERYEFRSFDIRGTALSGVMLNDLCVFASQSLLFLWRLMGTQ